MIAKIWNFLFYSCKHKWNTVKEINIYDSNSWSKLPIAKKYVLQCEKCGEIETKRI